MQEFCSLSFHRSVIIFILSVSLLSYTLLHLDDSFMHADSNMSDGLIWCGRFCCLYFSLNWLEVEGEGQFHSAHDRWDVQFVPIPASNVRRGRGGGGEAHNLHPILWFFVKAASNELDVVGFVAFISPWVELKVRVISIPRMTDGMSSLSPFQRATWDGGGGGVKLTSPIMILLCKLPRMNLMSVFCLYFSLSWVKVRVNSIPRMTDGMSSLSPFQRATGGGGGVKLSPFIPYYDTFVKAASNELDVVVLAAFISPWVELNLRVNSISYMTDEMSSLSPFQRATGGGGGGVKLTSFIPYYKCKLPWMNLMLPLLSMPLILVELSWLERAWESLPFRTWQVRCPVCPRSNRIPECDIYTLCVHPSPRGYACAHWLYLCRVFLLLYLRGEANISA